MATRHRTIAGILAAAALLWSSRCKNEITGVSPPAPATVDLRGTWKGTFGGSHCSSDIAASATFSQSNNVVTAALQPGADCDKDVTLEATVTGTGLTGGVWITRGTPDFPAKYRGNVTGYVSSSEMTLRIDRLCDTSDSEAIAGCVDGGTLVLNKAP